MRLLRTIWEKVSNVFANHEIGEELEGMSKWLDSHPEILEWVAEDLGSKELKQTGRHGMSVETVLRAGILKQYWQVSYKRLSFHLADSLSCKAFARLDGERTNKKSSLQVSISAIRDKTWERINRSMLKDAEKEKVESARKARVDSTVTKSIIHEPSDSSLLYDSMRVMGRLLDRSKSSWGFRKYHSHSKQSKQLARKVQYSKNARQRKPLYRKLVSLAKDNLKSLNKAQYDLTIAGISCPDYDTWCSEVSYYQPLIETVINQTERRVFNNEQVPASEKVVSLFESHTNIIVKSQDDEVQYGHKLNLTTGQSGMILDVVVEEGNPADSEQFLPMVERQIEIYGRVPRQIAADGSYASKDNLKKAKAEGIKDVAFHKKRGLSVEDMVKSNWVYNELKNFRAGIEGNISCMKRIYGLALCTWKGLSHFKAYVWSGVVAYNLALFARLREKAG